MNNIVSGLNAIHQQGYVHKDIRKENVIVMERDRMTENIKGEPIPLLKFIDYGLTVPQKNDNCTFDDEVPELGTLLYYICTGEIIRFVIFLWIIFYSLYSSQASNIVLKTTQAVTNDVIEIVSMV